MDKIAAKDHLASRSRALAQAKEIAEEERILSTATNLKDHNRKLYSRSADAFGQVDLVVSNAGIPIVASLNHDTGG